MAKQLSVGRLHGRRARTGRLGQVRPRAGLHQGRVAERQRRPRRSADERSGRGSRTRSAGTTRKRPAPGTHSYGCVVGGGTVTYGGSSWRHLPWEFNEATTRRRRSPAPASPTGRSPTRSSSRTTRRPNGRWASPGERIDSPFVAPMSKDYPGAAGAAEGVGRAVQDRRREAWLARRATDRSRSSTKPYQGRSACVNCGMCSGFGCHVKARSSSAVTMLPLAEKTGNCEIRVRSYVREISVDTSGKVTGVVYFDANKREVRQKREGGHPVGQRHGVAAAAAAVEVGAFPGRPGELERRGRQVPDARQHRQRQRALRASAERLQGRRHRRRHRRLRRDRSEARVLRRRPHDRARLRHADQLRPARTVSRARRAGAPPTRRRCSKKPTTR